MSIICSVLGHRPSSKTVWNDGHHFGTCARCRASLIECDEEGWTAPPPGYRIVWKKRETSSTYLRAPVAESWPETMASPLQEKRRQRDRRTNPSGPLPAELDGNDRRRGDRRQASGSYRPNRRRGLIAESPAEG